jgi:agmatine deiminase
MSERQSSLKSSPAADGFHMPAEWAPHERCWMLWPERPDNWRQRALPAQQAFALLAATIARFEPVTVGVSPRQLAFARAALLPHIRVVRMGSNDAWMRDVGPTFVIDGKGQRCGIDWRFNAWGGLYANCRRDDAVAAQVLAAERSGRYRAPMINEGGAIHTDGEGTLLVTEQCLLNRNRNPQLSRADIEQLLCDHLGVRKVIWLGKGVINDETDGHIDNLACFVAPGVVCLTWSDDRRDAQYRVSRDAWERLSSARDARGRRLKIHKLPSPGPLYLTAAEAAGIEPGKGIRRLRAGHRLAGSYVNFYLARGAVIAPLIDERTDGAALRILRRIFPRRQVVGVPAREILIGGGNIHCVTQQVPSARRVARRRSAATRV